MLFSMVFYMKSDVKASVIYIMCMSLQRKLQINIRKIIMNMNYKWINYIEKQFENW